MFICQGVNNHPIANQLGTFRIKVVTHTQIMIFITNITIFAQSTFQVCLRNFYESTIINWKIMRTASKLAQVYHIFKIQSNQILFEFQSFFKYSVVGSVYIYVCMNICMIRQLISNYVSMGTAREAHSHAHAHAHACMRTHARVPTSIYMYTFIYAWYVN